MRPVARCLPARKSGNGTAGASPGRCRRNGRRLKKESRHPRLSAPPLCVEPREGILRIFMPPLEKLEPYLALVSAIEKTAKELQQPVLLEGYEPPSDHRLSHFRITPDPGVIEVNVQPVRTWDELVEQTETLYADAYECRLTSEKFMMDGRHTGTGGGKPFCAGFAKGRGFAVPAAPGSATQPDQLLA